MNENYSIDDNENVGGLFAVLPAIVRYDKKIPPMGRLIYAEITALSNQKGFCWAGNSYFAKVFEITKGTVSELIAKLKENGYIYSEITNKNGAFEQRKLYPIFDHKSIANKDILKNRGIPEKTYTHTEKTVGNIIIKSNNKSILKNTTVFKKTDPILKKDLSTKKENFLRNEFVDFWNELGAGSKHKDPSKKVYRKAAIIFSKMLKGKLSSGSDFDRKFLNEFSISQDIINKRWSKDEIKDGLTKLAEAIKDGSGIYNVDRVRKMPLTDLIIHPKTKKSYFLQFTAGTQKKISVRDKEVFKQYKDFMGDQLQTKNQENLMASTVNGFYDEIMNIYKKVEKVYSHTSFSSYFGSTKNPTPFFIQHIEYLKTRKNISTNNIKVNSYCWSDFIKYVTDKYKFNIYPSKDELKNLEKEYERVQRKHENLKLQRGSR